jgi:hypothetical protein
MSYSNIINYIYLISKFRRPKKRAQVVEKDDSDIDASHDGPDQVCDDLTSCTINCIWIEWSQLLLVGIRRIFLWWRW